MTEEQTFYEWTVSIAPASPEPWAAWQARAAFAAPVAPAVPVAWMYRTRRNDGTEGSRWHLISAPDQRDAMSASLGAPCKPLYATPQPAAELKAEYERGRQAGITQVYDSMLAAPVAPAVSANELIKRLRQFEALDGCDQHELDTLREAADEIERLTAALAKANNQAEHFERAWYLRGDMLEDLASQPLTDSRIWELALATSSTQGGWESGWNVAFARAIEAAHGIEDKP